MSRFLIALPIVLLAACASGPERVPAAPTIPPPDPESNETIVVSVTTTQSESSAGSAGLQALLEAESDDPTLNGKVEVDLGSGGANAGEVETLQVDRETWRAIISNPEVWTVSFVDGKWTVSNAKKEPEPSAALPLNVDESHRFSSSRSVKLKASLGPTGDLVGTFRLENDAMVVGFGASASVDLLGARGEVLATAEVPHQRIGGKPPGKAIRQEHPVNLQVRDKLALSKVERLRVRFHGGS